MEPLLRQHESLFALSAVALFAGGSLPGASSKTGGFGIVSAPVVEREDDPTFLGIVTGAHFVRATNEAIRTTRAGERGS